MIPECTGGQVYNSCGSACTKTCDDPMPRCSKQCVPKCECPSNSPIWYGSYTCIVKEQCPVIVPEVTTDAPEEPTIIPEPLPECTGGQIFNTCGSSCTKTCDDPMPRCSKECVSKCECPSDKPIYYGGYICMEQNRCPAVEEPATEDADSKLTLIFSAQFPSKLYFFTFLLKRFGDLTLRFQLVLGLRKKCLSVLEVKCTKSAPRTVQVLAKNSSLSVTESVSGSVSVPLIDLSGTEDTLVLPAANVLQWWM